MNVTLQSFLQTVGSVFKNRADPLYALYTLYTYVGPRKSTIRCVCYHSQLKGRLNAARRTLNKILTTVEMDWKGSLDLDAYATTGNAYLSHRISNSIVSFQAISVVMYSVMVIIFGAVDDDETTGEIVRPLITKMDLPFDSSKRFVYESVMLTQFLHMLLCAIANGMLNALLIALVSCALSWNVTFIIVVAILHV